MVKLNRSKVSGTIRAPPSKPIALRLIFSSIFTYVNLQDLQSSDDVDTSLRVVEALGVSREGTHLKPPVKPKLRLDYLNLGGSGTSLRFLIPIFSILGGRLTIDGDETLRRRPLNDLLPQLESLGMRVSSYKLPLTLEGRIDADEVELKGLKSSQYISGFIYAFMLRGGGTISFPTDLGSMSYIRLTADLLNQLGAKVRIGEGVVKIDGGPTLDFTGPVPGDYLFSSFYAGAGILSGGEVEISGLPDPPDYFGDHSIVKLFAEMGAVSFYDEGKWRVEPGSLRGIDVDVNQAPDLAPSVAVLSAMANGETRLRGVERLRLKESDRVSTISEALRRFGIEVTEGSEEILIRGSPLPHYGHVKCPNDHRIAMMAGAIGSTVGALIEQAECVRKSNPKFWEDLRFLGTRLEILET
jgi:3-phosphoshikimate 1-carboxyvinyltransferase